MKLARSGLSRIELPILLLQGERDPIVDAGLVTHEAARIASPDKQVVLLPNAFHEPLNELDRKDTQRLIADWIAAHVSEAAP